MDTYNTQIDDAVKSFRAAAKFRPDQPEMWSNLVTALRDQAHDLQYESPEILEYLQRVQDLEQGMMEEAETDVVELSSESGRVKLRLNQREEYNEIAMWNILLSVLVCTYTIAHAP